MKPAQTWRNEGETGAIDLDADNLNYIEERISELAPQVKIVDLGIIDFAHVFANGPQTLYEMADGEFLRSIKFTDTDFIAPVGLGFEMYGLECPLGIGTVKSFSWNAFAGGSKLPLSDTEGLQIEGLMYGPELNLLTGKAAVLSLAAGGPIQASFFFAGSPPTVWGWRVAGIDAWQPKTHYDGNPEPAELVTVAPQRDAIVADGAVWWSAAPGESGEEEPDFAKAHEEAGEGERIIVEDGTIMWESYTVEEGGFPVAPVTAGTVHAVAEIWTPS